jgi:hypothetical protein
MLHFLNKPVIRFILGLLMFILGFWMLSPFAVIPYGQAILSIGNGVVFLLLYLLAVFLAAGGLGLLILSFCNE